MTVRRLLPSRRGRAIKRAEIYCDDTSPGSFHPPPTRRPEQRRSSPSDSIVMPWRRSSASKGASGRAARRPRRRKRTEAPSTPATGSRKRSVEPLSPQGSSSSPAGISRIGRTRMRSPVIEKEAPRAVRQSAVAAISRETPSQRISQSVCPSAAQMRRRWAWDLEAGMRMLPLRMPPGIVTVIVPLRRAAILRPPRVRPGRSRSGRSRGGR